MQKAITFVVLLTTITLAWDSSAQKEEKKSQSYKSFKLRSSVNDASNLLKEAAALKATNPAEALNKVEEALGVSLAQRDEFNEGKCYVLLAEINESIEEWKLALENYDHAYQKLKNAYSVSVEYQKALSGLAQMHLKLGHFEIALTYFKELLTLDLGNSEKAETQLHLSEVYYQMGKYMEALSLTDAIAVNKWAEEEGSFSARLQNQKAKIYARLNELTKTKDLYQNSISTLRSNKSAGTNLQDQQSLQSAKEEIADVYRQQKRYDDEIDLRNQSIEYNLESNNLLEVAKDKAAISKTLEAKGNASAALKEIEEAARIAEKLSNPKEQASAFLTLAQQYEKNGKINQALSAYNKYSNAVGLADKENEVRLTETSQLIRKQKDIEELTKDVSLGQQEETIEKATVFRQQLIIYGLLFIILVIGVASYFIYKNAQASKVANQLLALKSLRSQMNPHFIFNALNSVNHFIAQQDERTANKFLSEFSQLMRLVLENSQEDFIPLQKEQEILSLYLKLEHYRFRDKFEYEIEIDKELNTETIEVPPMLIQPYIENAVWHGLRYREEKGKLALRIHREEETLVVEITDDGIGRKKSKELKTANQKKHQSTGLKNIEERLAIINKVYKANYKVVIDDLVNDCGTRVRLYLPIHQRIN